MKQLFLDFANAFKDLNILSFVFILIEFAKAVGFLPHIPDIIGYIVIIITGVYFLSKLKTISPLMITLLVYLTFNILSCTIPAVFTPWMRFGLFTLLLIVVSPFVQSKYVRMARRNMLNVVLWIASILSVASFFCRFLGINYMFRVANAEYNTAGTFSGLFMQSMILGPTAGISSVFLTYRAYICQNNKTRIWYLAASLACIGAVFFSASRSALLCTFAGICLMFMNITHGRRKFLKTATLIVLVTAITFPIWGGITEGVIEKNNNNVQAGSAFSSREGKWNARITEFKSSPIIGIGFSSVDPKLDDVSFWGTVEPGSSWLAALSMTGLVGTFLLFLIFLEGYKACRKMNSQYDALLSGLLTLFTVHMFAEGYVFAAGGFLCFLLWLIIGCSIDRKYE